MVKVLNPITVGEPLYSGRIEIIEAISSIVKRCFRMISPMDITYVAGNQYGLVPVLGNDFSTTFTTA